MTLTFTIADTDWARVLAAVIYSPDFDRMAKLHPGLSAEQFALSVMWQAVSTPTQQLEQRQAIKAAEVAAEKPKPFTVPTTTVDGVASAVIG